MATEIARIDVAPGDAEAFVAAAGQAVALFRDAPGCSAMRLQRSHEAAGRFWLIVEWQDVAAQDRKSTRLNTSHQIAARMPSYDLKKKDKSTKHNQKSKPNVVTSL